MILIAPDKYKGTFTANEVCDIVADELRRGGIASDIVCRPLADGGENTQRVALREPLPTTRKGVYVDADGSAACVVSAEVIGPGCFAPELPLMRRSSRALGEAVAYACTLPVDTIYVAIGGTAASDGGAGMLAALGARFFDVNGADMSDAVCASNLCRIARVDVSGLITDNRLCGVVDVCASLCGPGLSAIDFARQKALSGEDLSALAGNLRHFGSLFPNRSPRDGAGGGTGFALCSVLGARAVGGAELAVAHLGVDWNEVDVVITGEGCVDVQTVSGGKLVDAVVDACNERRVPCIVVPGTCNALSPYRYMFPTTDYAGGTYEARLRTAVRAAIPLIKSLLKK